MLIQYVDVENFDTNTFQVNCEAENELKSPSSHEEG